MGSTEDRLQFWAHQQVWNDRAGNILTHGYVIEYNNSTASPPPNSNPNQPPGVQWSSQSGGNNHYYEAVAAPNGINWANANAAAVAQGGYLVTITSATENTFVFNLISGSQYWSGSIGPWLGGFQPAGSSEPAGGWQWLNNDGGFSYTSWSSIEPNNSGGSEDRVQYWMQQSVWNDCSGNITTHGYVIEFNPPSPPVVLPEASAPVWWSDT